MPGLELAKRPMTNQIISITGSEPELLTKIYDAHIKICIMTRQISSEVKAYTEFLQKMHSGFELIRQISVADLKNLLCGTLPQHQLRPLFIEDVMYVGEMFSCLLDLEYVGLRFCVLNKTMCPRFHTDKVPCRLITTYGGKGTEWLDLDISDSSYLSENNPIPNQYSNILSLSEGDIALLKGDKWQGKEGHGVIHRSPSLGLDETRLLLTLDCA